MKPQIQNLFLALALLIVVQQASAAVTFAVTPAAISNTYAGVITLQVAGLTSGDTVVMQKFLDANTNGLLDGNDVLWQQFQLTDNSASVFHNGAAAVTNFYVPGDTDGSANGAIAARLYPALDFAQLVVGKYLFKLSSPAGHFSPITNTFAVTNFPFAQTISGNVFSNSTAISNAIVILFQPQGDGQNPAGGTVANNSGAYTIKMPVGNYQLVAFKSNFVANLSVSPYVALGAGATLITNVPVTNATTSISGKIVDANNSAIGLPGMLVPVQSTNNLIALAFTDTNGIFTARVTPSLWKIQPSSQAIVLHGYLKMQSSLRVDTSTGAVSGLTISLPKATAIFYGTVKDTLNHPLGGVEMDSADNNNNLYESDGALTDTNGNYVSGALTNELWNVEVVRDGNYGFTNYDFSVGTQATLSPGQAYPYNFTAIAATHHITGNVQDSDGNPIAGVEIDANATINSVQYATGADTDRNGNYSLTVANGGWSADVNCNGGDSSLDGILGNGNYQCPDSQNVTINNNNGSLNFVVQLSGSGLIYGYVMDIYGAPIIGVDVHADDGHGDIYSGTTDGSGYYTINVGNGEWDIYVDCGELSSMGYVCAGDNSVTISDDQMEADFTVQASPRTYSFTVLHGFSALDSNTGTNNDGAHLYGGLALSGNTLCGTADSGGTNGYGTVFKLNTDGSGFSVLHHFTGGTDGANPDASLILLSNLLWGMAYGGGNGGDGTIFKISTNGGNFLSFYSFSAGAYNDSGAYSYWTNKDGAYPNASLTWLSNTLYSAAYQGGTNGVGVIFKVSTNGGNYTILHTFTALDASTATTNADGAYPAALIGSGNTLYGTSSSGGTYGYGTIFSLITNGTSFTVLYSFTDYGGDGASPYAGLILAGGVLYGTTSSGGDWGNGTVFAVSTNGSGFTVLHSFTGGEDGAGPEAALILSSNVLYGTAINGGNDNEGTVFAVGTNGTGFAVLHSFTGGGDGSNPSAELILSNNTLYGTAFGGGSFGNGTVFSLSLTNVIVSSPQLTLTLAGPNVILTWPTNFPGFTLQSATNLIPPALWNPVSPAPATLNDQNVVTNSISGKQMFYRLSQ